MEESGVPKDVVTEIDAFHPKGVKLESVTHGAEGSRKARELVRGAIRIAVADGYSEIERETVMHAAWILGVPPRLVLRVLEALAQLEHHVHVKLDQPKVLDRLMPIFHGLLETRSPDDALTLHLPA